MMISAEYHILKKRRLWFAAICLLLTGCTAGTGPGETIGIEESGKNVAIVDHPTDSLQVVFTAIGPGDTAMIEIMIANTENLGGYTLRIAYDTSLMDVVTISDGTTVVAATQLRGDFRTFSFGTPEPGITAGIGAFSASIEGLTPGRGPTIRLPFYVKEYVTPGTQAEITFVDSPFDSNANNWFSTLSGTGQYRPVRVAGKIVFPDETQLFQNYPNPFHPVAGAITTISYYLRGPGAAHVAIYSVSGNLIRTLSDNPAVNRGFDKLTWDGSDLAGEPVLPGVYLCRMDDGHETYQQKIAVLR